MKCPKCKGTNIIPTSDSFWETTYGCVDCRYVSLMAVFDGTGKERFRIKNEV